MKSFARVFKGSGFVQSGSFVNTRDGWEQRFNLASWKSQCPRKPWENLSWETCQTKRMATWMERYVPSAKRRRWRYDYISDYECIFNHPVSHAGNKQEYWKKLQDAKTRLGGTTMQIRELAHFTNPEAADQIVNDHGFRRGAEENLQRRKRWWHHRKLLVVESHIYRGREKERARASWRSDKTFHWRKGGWPRCFEEPIRDFWCFPA